MNDFLVDVPQRLWGELEKGAVESIMFGNGVAVEVSKATQGEAVVDTLTQFAIVPVFDPHQNQRAQDLRWRHARAPGARFFQAPFQILTDLLDQRFLLIEESGDGLQGGVELDAQALEVEVGEGDLLMEDSAHGSLLGTQQLMVEFADALQGGFQFLIIAEPLPDGGDQFGPEAELFGAAARVADGQHPDGMALAAGADGTTGAVADAAMEQGTAEDFGGGGHVSGELGAGGEDPFLIHLHK